MRFGKYFTRVGTVLGAACLAAGIWVGILGYDQLMKGEESLAWPATEGVIIASEVRKEEKTNDDAWYSAYVLYEYSVERVTYSSTQVAFGSVASGEREHWQQIVARYPQGTIVTVYYDPEVPSVSVLEQGITPAAYVFLIVGLLFSTVGLAVIGYVWIVGPRIRQGRTQALRKAAVGLGLSFREEDGGIAGQAFFRFPVFQRGSSPEIRKVKS